MLPTSMRLRLRRAAVPSIVSVTAVLITLVWFCHLDLFASSPIDSERFDTFVSTILTVTANVGAIAIAVFFLTAQISGAKSRPSVLAKLYGNSEVYVLLGGVALALALGFVVLGLGPDSPTVSIGHNLLNSVVILGTATVLLIFPVLVSQLENLNPAVLATKLADAVTVKEIVEYGLIVVGTSGREQVVTAYQLATVGLRPRSVDPLRPLHEIVMEAVEARDRVLFGKLFRCVLRIMARVHGVSFDAAGDNHRNKTSRFRSFMSRWYTPAERVQVSLTILHYAVKRARNLRSDWEGRDIGRHGILTGVGDLVLSLAWARDSIITLRASLYAVYHVTFFYKDIEPYGRIEPLNLYFQAAAELERASKNSEAVLCVQILAWAKAHTAQLRSDRLVVWQKVLSETLAYEFLCAVDLARIDPLWIPGIESEDPWRDWPHEP